MTAGLPNPPRESQSQLGQSNHAAAMDPHSWSPRIRARYAVGDSRARRIAAIAGAIALLLAPVAVWSLWQAGRHDVAAVLGPYTLSNSTARVEFTYQSRGDATSFVTCAIRAQDARRIDVGFAYLRLRGTAGKQRTVSYTLTTTSPSVAAELLGCQSGDGTERLPTAQFPPGVKPPAQPAPGYAPSASGAIAGGA